MSVRCFLDTGTSLRAGLLLLAAGLAACPTSSNATGSTSGGSSATTSQGAASSGLASSSGSSTGTAATSGGSGRSRGSSGFSTSGRASTGGASSGVASSTSASSTGGSASASGGSSTGSLPPAGAPIVVYTDLASGPNSGGENGDGVYLSIFGRNFGSAPTVTIGGAAVARVIVVGTSLGRSDVQQITVQVGALGNPTAGTALPIAVTVNGVASNTDQTFTVNPGRLLFVDGVNGNDATAVAGDITHPYQHVQLTTGSATALGVAQPGDTLVLRAGSYSTLGNSKDFVKLINVGGSAPTGVSGTGPIAFISYPGETVNIVNGLGGVDDAAAFSGVDHSSGYSGGNWVTIAGLHIEGDGTAGVIALQVQSDHWRVVNDELSAPNTSGANVEAGGVNGDGTNMAIYGNSIHDITGSGGENHGVYLDGDGSYDVAYNVIYNVASGYGIQAYNDAGNSPTTSNVHVHHNLIHDVTGKGCLNVADGSATGHEWWDNVCYNINLSCLRFNDFGTLSGAQIFNNTFYNCGAGSSYDGAIDSDGDLLAASAVTIVNTIVWPASGIPYTGGSGNGFGTGVFANDLWFGSSGAPSGPGALTANPGFVAAGSNFELAAGSPALAAGLTSVLGTVTSDFDLGPLAAGSNVDVGAY